MKTDTLQTRITAAIDPPANSVASDIIYWKWSTNQPIGYYIKFFDTHICKVNVKGPRIDELVVPFLTKISAADFSQLTPANNLCHIPMAPTGPGFDRCVLIHPSMTRNLNTFSDSVAFVGSITYSAFAAFACELSEQDSIDEARFRYSKAIPFSNWARSPSPAVNARFHFKKSKYKSGGKKLDCCTFDKLREYVEELADEDGFVEVENFLKEPVRIEHEKKHYTIVQGTERWQVKAGAIGSWLLSFTTRGLKIVDMERAKYVA